MRLDSMKNIEEEKILRATKSYPEYFGIDILLKILNKFGKICDRTVRRDMEEHYIAYIKLNNLYYFKKNEIIDCFKSHFNKSCDECIFDCKNISFDEIILENRELFRKELSDLEIEELISSLAVEHFSDINFKHTFLDSTSIYRNVLEESIKNKEIKSYKINTVNLLSTKDFSKLLFKHYHKKIREGTIFTTLKTKKITKKN